MSRYRKITTICCAAVLALGLAACGGGDDGISVADRDAAVAAEQAKTDALQMEINALRAQLGLDPADDLDTSIQGLQDEIARLQGEIDDAADKARMDQEEADRKAMAATAAKLYKGISMPMGTAGSPDPDDRIAGYNTAETGIDVSIGNGTDNPTATPLSEDKKTIVAANHGWEGKRYADVAGGPMVEAMVYSNVEAPEEGDPFNKVYTIADKKLTFTFTTSAAATDLVASRVGGSNFDHSAGIKQFKVPTPNPNAETVVTIAGTYHGVSGTYSCTPDDADACGVRKAVKGFDLGTVDDGTFMANEGSWMFEPSSPTAKVMSTPDGAYASYGWWIHKTADDKNYIASAFVDVKGSLKALDTSAFNALAGTAMYMGGAAGKYALRSSTGGTNDAGHFTAMATLEADFGNVTAPGMISGTIHDFMGADGMSRNWEVELKKGTISAVEDGAAGMGMATNGTVWTIGDTAADAAGSWDGHLRDRGNDDVPKIATGTFYTTFGEAGKMVGAFGANVQ